MSKHPSHLDGAEFLSANTAGLYEPAAVKSLGETAKRAGLQNRAVIDAIPQWQSWRESAHRLKHWAISNLDKLLVEFEQNITARGAKVHFALDAREANELVLQIARQHGVRTVVKSKSMVSEEIDLNENLAAAGIRAVETDLGEYLVQLAGQRPVHIVTPAIHMSAADCGRLFQEKLGEPFTEQHEALTAIARKHLREEFIHADMGVSGVNAAIAETGSIAIVENEGNAGLSIASPPVHVALMGIEKLIPRVADLPLLLNLLPRSGTGQKLTTYTHLIQGATPGRELHIIIIDNGRTRMLQDRACNAALHCIRCGACLNNCPVYQRAGGWAYGWVYPGPIGSLVTPQLVGLDKAGELPFASSLCGLCGEVCPVKIDIPHQLVHLRHRAVVERSPVVRSWIDWLMWTGWSFAMRGSWRYGLTMWGVRVGSRLAPFLPWHPGKMGAWTRGRDVPTPKGPMFRSWWRRQGQAETQQKIKNAKP